MASPYDKDLARECDNYLEYVGDIKTTTELVYGVKAIMVRLGPVACWSIALDGLRADSFSQWKEPDAH